MIRNSSPFGSWQNLVVVILIMVIVVALLIRRERSVSPEGIRAATAPQQSDSMSAAIRTVYGKYGDFSGRAPRSEYWWFTLFFILVYGGLFLTAAVADMTIFGLLAIIFALGSLLPSIAVSVRRLHDTGRSGWWFLLNFVPLGSLVVLVFMCLASDGDNEYGPRPGGATGTSDHPYGAQNHVTPPNQGGPFL